MSVKLSISEGDKRAELEVTKPNNLQILNIISGLFEYLGVSVPEVLVSNPMKVKYLPQVKSESSIENVDEIREFSSEETIVLDKQETSCKEDSQISKSRILPLINSERTLTQPLGEKLASALGMSLGDQDTVEGTMWIPGEDNPLNHPIKVEGNTVDMPIQNSGIREVDGMQRYQTYIYCKNLKCGKRSKVFIPEHQKSVYCPSCNTKHARRDASPEGFPHQDSFGNYYKADQLWVENKKSRGQLERSPM